MVLTWITTFTMLPALLCVLARRGALKPKTPPKLGEWLVRALPQRRLGSALVLARPAHRRRDRDLGGVHRARSVHARLARPAVEHARDHAARTS